MTNYNGGDFWMNKYTVILLYPDYLADTFGQTYIAHVQTRTVDEAIKKVQMEVAKGDKYNADNFRCLYVFSGHLFDIKVPYKG